MKKLKLNLTFILLIVSINTFSQKSVWWSTNKDFNINYNEKWKYTQPNDVMIVKFMPNDEYPNGKLTSISLTETKVIDSKIKNLEDINKFMQGYITNFENGKLVSFENIKDGNREVLISTISLTRDAIPTMYKSYIFICNKKIYTLMLISRKIDYEQNEIILKEMYKSIIIK